MGVALMTNAHLFNNIFDLLANLRNRFRGNSRRVKTVETLQFLQWTKVLEHRHMLFSDFFYTSDERNSTLVTREHAHVCNLKGINFRGLPITHENRENLYSYGMCLFPCNLGECFVSLLVEPIAGKNVSPSDKQLWRF